MSLELHRMFAAWSLLVAMALVVTPRVLFHHCDRSDAHATESSTGAELTTACSVCDADMVMAVDERTSPLLLVLEVQGVALVPDLLTPDPGHTARTADRGPPTIR